MNVKTLGQYVSESRAIPIDRIVWYLARIAYEMIQYHNKVGASGRLNPQSILIATETKDVTECISLDWPRLQMSGLSNNMAEVDFIAPECLRESATRGESADVYSLGCILFYMMHCQPMFTDSSVTKKLILICNSQRPLLFKERFKIFTPIENMFQRMVEIDPKARQASMSEVAAEISGFT